MSTKTRTATARDFFKRHGALSKWHPNYEFRAGQLEMAEAVEAAQRCLADHPAYHAPRRFLVAALGQLGREDEGAAALREWLTVAPDVFEVMVRNRPPYVRVSDHEQLLDGLRKVGWQDRSGARRRTRPANGRL